MSGHEPVTFTVLAPVTLSATAVLRQAGAAPQGSGPSRYDLDTGPAAIETIVRALAGLDQPFTTERHITSVRRSVTPQRRAAGTQRRTVETA